MITINSSHLDDEYDISELNKFLQSIEKAYNYNFAKSEKIYVQNNKIFISYHIGNYELKVFSCPIDIVSKFFLNEKRINDLELVVRFTDGDTRIFIMIGAGTYSRSLISNGIDHFYCSTTVLGKN